MAKNKNNFLMYYSWKPLIVNLSDEQIGDIMRGLYAIVDGEEYTFREDNKALGEFFAGAIVENLGKYKETCEKRREAAFKKHHKDANASNCMQMDAIAYNCTINTSTNPKTKTNTNPNPNSFTNPRIGETTFEDILKNWEDFGE